MSGKFSNLGILHRLNFSCPGHPNPKNKKISLEIYFQNFAADCLRDSNLDQNCGFIKIFLSDLCQTRGEIVTFSIYGQLSNFSKSFKIIPLIFVILSIQDILKKQGG